MTRRLWVATGALAVIALVTVVVFVSRNDDSTNKQLGVDIAQSPTTTVTQPATTVPQQEPYASLATILPPELAGYQIDTGAKATGPLDLNAAVAAETDTQAERSLLETRHYERGYARSFTDGDTDVYMVVYDFVANNDASFYLTDGFINLYGKGAGTYDVPEVPGARGFSQGTESDGRPAVVHGVAFAKADRFVLVFTRSASTSTPAQAKDLAVTLYPRA